jgi:hypothetical protein
VEPNERLLHFEPLNPKKSVVLIMVDYTFETALLGLFDEGSSIRIINSTNFVLPC